MLPRVGTNTPRLVDTTPEGMIDLRLKFSGRTEHPDEISPPCNQLSRVMESASKVDTSCDRGCFTLLRPTCPASRILTTYCIQDPPTIRCWSRHIRQALYQNGKRYTSRLCCKFSERQPIMVLCTPCKDASSNFSNLERKRRYCCILHIER